MQLFTAITFTAPEVKKPHWASDVKSANLYVNKAQFNKLKQGNFAKNLLALVKKGECLKPIFTNNFEHFCIHFTWLEN